MKSSPGSDVVMRDATSAADGIASWLRGGCDNAARGVFVLNQGQTRDGAINL
jgi:hypothetical protein